MNARLVRIGKWARARAQQRGMRRTLVQIERARVIATAVAAARSVDLQSGYPISIEQLADTFRSLGVQAGDLVHVQSSVSHLYRGSAERTTEHSMSPAAYAAAVVDLLLELLGGDGTIVMNTDALARGAVRRAWAGLVPPGEALFDYRSSPTRRGLIAELFRRRRGVIRSVHPWYNMAALGPRADELMRDHELSTPYTMDTHSPTYKLTLSGGKILLLGRSFGGNTPLHLAEYMYPDEFPRPIFLNRPIPMTYVGREGDVKSIDVMLHASGWYVDEAETLRFCSYLDEQHRIYQRRPFHGGVEIVACDALAQYEATLTEMRAGVTLYDPRFA